MKAYTNFFITKFKETSILSCYFAYHCIIHLYNFNNNGYLAIKLIVPIQHYKFSKIVFSYIELTMTGDQWKTFCFPPV